MKITDNDVTVNIKEIKKPELNAISQKYCQQLVKDCLPKSNEKSNAISL